MRRLALLTIAIAMLAGCGSEQARDGGDSEDGRDTTSRLTLAAIEFRGPGVDVRDVFALAAERHVQVTELEASYDFGDGDHCGSGFVVARGSAVREVAPEFQALVADGIRQCFSLNRGDTPAERIEVAARRRRVPTDPRLVTSMQAQGPSDRLQSLEDDARVDSVFVKP